MKLADLGEFGLIHRFAPLFQSNLPIGVEGIGNDCAVIPFRDNLSYLVTNDSLNENIHFIKDKINPYDLGYKSLAVNLSDIAAMGGKPHYAFMAIGFPPSTSLEWIDAFVAGFHKLAMETQTFLLGGDTTRADQITISILVIGLIETAYIKRRSQAQADDIICCTGYLGNSGAGLNIILEELPQHTNMQALIQAHVRPRPHLEEGAWLATQPGVHAMMDISDGLASDIRRIMEESRCGAHIQVENIPLSPELKQACQQLSWRAEHFGLTGGEDYCLLATVNPQDFPSLQQAYFKRFQRPLFPIGKILASSELKYTFHENIFTLQGNGFDHFKA